jgi:hypothetical protein
MDNFLSENLHLVNIVLEQPFLNVYLYREKIYNTILTEVISHSGYYLDNFDGLILHFAGGPGSFETKWEKMNSYKNKNLS